MKVAMPEPANPRALFSNDDSSLRLRRRPRPHRAPASTDGAAARAVRAQVAGSPDPTTRPAAHSPSGDVSQGVLILSAEPAPSLRGLGPCPPRTQDTPAPGRISGESSRPGKASD